LLPKLKTAACSSFRKMLVRKQTFVICYWLFVHHLRKRCVRW